MKFEIVGVRERGNAEKERIVLKALSDLELGYYMISLTNSNTDDSFDSSTKNMFWFPDQSVKKDDLVVLYTKKGSISKNANTSGNVSYFFYMGLEKPFFTSSNKIAVLLDINGWKSM